MKKGRVYEQAILVYPGVCFECDAPGAHRHHVVPATRGGRRVVWLCEACHEKTHGYDEGVYAMMRLGRREKMKSGEYGGGKRLARRYGSRLVEVQGKFYWHPVDAEQAIIRRIRAVHDDGTSYRAIARTLNAEGVPTVTGTLWSHVVVRELVRRAFE